MKKQLERYLQGQLSEQEFDELFDYIKENGTEWMEPILREQWDEIGQAGHMSLFDKEKLFDGIRISTQKQVGKSYYFYRIAASVVLICIIGVLYLVNREDNPESKMRVFKTKENYKLPDGTLVSLAANSTLQLSEWRSEAPREVWLSGQAFFNVRKAPERLDPKFIVHTPNLDIEVLGTKFSVEAYEANTKVALKTGKVRIVNEKGAVDMVPGELVVFETGSDVFEKTEINTESYLPLTEKVISFEDETLLKVTQKIKEIFNVNIVLVDESLDNKRFTGEANIDDLESFYEVLKEVFKVSIVNKPEKGLVEISLIK